MAQNPSRGAVASIYLPVELSECSVCFEEHWTAFIQDHLQAVKNHDFLIDDE